MRQLKILFFHLDLNIGGVERQLYYLVNGLTKHHDVNLLLCEKKGDFVKQLDRKISVSSLDTRYKHQFQFKMMVGLIAQIKKKKPNVLISFHGKLHWISFLCAKILGVKVVCVFPGYASRGIMWPIHNIVYNLSDGLIAVSDSVKSSMINNLLINKNKIKVIENAIDIKSIYHKSNEPLTPQEKQYFGKNIPIIISIGRIVHGKGYDVILSALSIIEFIIDS